MIGGAGDVTGAGRRDYDRDVGDAVLIIIDGARLGSGDKNGNGDELQQKHKARER